MLDYLSCACNVHKVEFLKFILKVELLPGISSLVI